MLSPFATLSDPFGFDSPFPAPRRRRAAPELTPEEEQSLVSSIGDTVGSGFQFVGDVLDTPGRFVRTSLAGENPFATIFNPREAPSGRDLLEKWGMAGPNTDQGWIPDAGDVAGFGAEVLFDPLTYMTLGASAVGKAGKALKSAGVLDDALRATGKGKRLSRITTKVGDVLDTLTPVERQAAEHAAKKQGVNLAASANETVGGLVGIGLPFMDPLFTVGRGKTAQKIAKAMDVVGGAAAASPVGRFGRMLFDPDVQGKFGKHEQDIAAGASRLSRKLAPEARMKYADLLDEYNQVGEAFAKSYGHTLPDTQDMADVFDRIVRMSGETKSTKKAFEHVSPALPMKGSEPQLLELAQKMQGANRELADQLREAGVKLELMGLEPDAILQHLPRYISKEAQAAHGFTQQFPRSFGSSRMRSRPIRDIPTELVNAMLADTKGRAPDALLNKYGQFLNPNYRLPKRLEEKFAKATFASDAEKTAFYAEASITQHAKELAKWLRGKKPDPLFTRHTPEDFLKYHLNGRRTLATTQAIHQTLAQNAGEEGVGLMQAFADLGMDPKRASEHFARVTGKDPSLLKVAPEVIDAAKGVMRVAVEPEWRKVVGNTIDKYLRWWKQSVTLPWPSFMMRNLGSGQAMNILSGVVTDLPSYSKQFYRAAKLAKNPDKNLLRELYAHQVVDPRFGFEGVELTQEQLARKTLESPQSIVPKGMKGILAEAEHQTNQPSLLGEKVGKLPGVRQVRKGFNTVTEAGARLNYKVEWQNRVSLYLYLKEKGWSPAAAAQKVRELHFDYADLSPFEKDYMRRLFPFYTFSRKMAELTFRTLWEKPGGALAQSIRATNEGRGETGMVPDYVSGTSAIPLPGAPEGTKRFLTGLGLAHEDTLGFLGGGLRGGLQELGSRMNPLPKAAIEWGLDRSLFQKGRSIDDMDPMLGRTLANVTGEKDAVRFPGSKGIEFGLANSPLARLFSTAKTATDTRKGLAEKGANLLTGLRITDVSPAAQDAVLRERASEILKKEKGGREFTRAYLPEENLAKMTPEERKQAEQYLALLTVLAERAKKRKKEAGR